jgi:3-oxoacyl-[acyl-carrier protein] reductase
MNDLYGRIAIVTGGATGIGAAIVNQLVCDGAKVACCYNKSKNNAQTLERELKKKGFDNILIIKMDVTDIKEIESKIESIAKYFGHYIDILVNNAGAVFGNAPIDELKVETWDKIMTINLRSIFLCSRYCIPAMKKQKRGTIVNISSISAKSGGGPGASHYAASKGGVEAFTRALAKELGLFNITVNAVAPGVISTPIHERTNTLETLERVRKTIPLLRLGNPEEVARVVSFLCSDDASYITGEVIDINGGMRMG